VLPGAPLTPGPPPAARSGSKTVLAVLGLAGVGLVLLVGLCCGGSLWIVRTVKREDAARIQRQFQDHPRVVEQLGGIDSCEPNLSAELAAGSEYDGVFDVQGPRGRGRILESELFGVQLSVLLRTSGGEWELLDQVPAAHV
jgi:hypothetical protein